MKHFVFATTEYSDMIYDIFLPSFKKYNDNEVIINIINSTVDEFDEKIQSSNTQYDKAKGFYKFIDYKFKKTIECLENNIGNIIHITDPDVVYFKPIVNVFESMMINNDLLISMRDNNWYNVGQLIIRSNENTISFFKYWYNRWKKEYKWEEEVFNDIISESIIDDFSIKYNKLPYTFSNTISWIFKLKNKNDIYSFHAINTENILGLDQKDRIKSKYQLMNIMNSNSNNIKLKWIKVNK